MSERGAFGLKNGKHAINFYLQSLVLLQLTSSYGLENNFN
jgi:hypothetical protein